MYMYIGGEYIFFTTRPQTDLSGTVLFSVVVLYYTRTRRRVEGNLKQFRLFTKIETVCCSWKPVYM